MDKTICRNLLRLSVLVVLCGPSLVCAQTVYKCVDPKTKVTSYGDTPCATGNVSRLSITENAVIDSKDIYRDAARQQQQGAARQREAAVSGSASNSTPSSQYSGDRDLLAKECYRGFTASCRKLADANSAAGDVSHGPTLDVRDRLSTECTRGIKSSCGSLSALNRGTTASQPSRTASPTPTPGPKMASSELTGQPTTKRWTSSGSSNYPGTNRYEIESTPYGNSLSGSTEVEMRRKYDYNPMNKYRGEIDSDGSVRMRNYKGDVLRGNIEPDGYGKLRDSDGNTYRVKPY